MARASILLVEDDPLDVLLVERAVRQAALDVNLARVADGRSGFEVLRQMLRTSGPSASTGWSSTTAHG